eukprot:gnl/TRDRNA2_/TRDRNA2_168859_c0_seq1.p2 gnl/TRDRNA2_/TRDRNA2_168859_c0~~gnl/TRDRNA2_/TRDRNA2_168859_c0_seq1.p2  ORF type:complete len:105 (+),score=8.62 gnl/TRDRNA2_/TRDRNA2_168859_c0_seq1:2-316(+)
MPGKCLTIPQTNLRFGDIQRAHHDTVTAFTIFTALREDLFIDTGCLDECQELGVVTAPAEAGAPDRAYLLLTPGHQGPRILQAPFLEHITVPEPPRRYTRAEFH